MLRSARTIACCAFVFAISGRTTALLAWFCSAHARTRCHFGLVCTLVLRDGRDGRKEGTYYVPDLPVPLPSVCLYLLLVVGLRFCHAATYTLLTLLPSLAGLPFASRRAAPALPTYFAAARHFADYRFFSALPHFLLRFFCCHHQGHSSLTTTCNAYDFMPYARLPTMPPFGLAGVHATCSLRTPCVCRRTTPVPTALSVRCLFLYYMPGSALYFLLRRDLRSSTLRTRLCADFSCYLFSELLFCHLCSLLYTLSPCCILFIYTHVLCCIVPV